MLGVKKDATADEIKKAYRKLARANHPDSNPGDTAKHDTFKSVAEAYDVVGDTEKRVKYDEMRQLYGSGSAAGSAAASGVSGGGFDLNDLLRDRAGGAGAVASATCSATSSVAAARQARAASAEGRRRRDHGDDQLHRRHRRGHHLVAADLGRPLLRLQRHRWQGRHQAARLSRVRGRRFHRVPAGGAFSINETCPMCGGRQLVYDQACPTCHGNGRGLSARTHPGPDPRRCQGRSADPAARQGGGRGQRRPCR